MALNNPVSVLDFNRDLSLHLNLSPLLEETLNLDPYFTLKLSLFSRN